MVTAVCGPVCQRADPPFIQAVNLRIPRGDTALRRKTLPAPLRKGRGAGCAGCWRRAAELEVGMVRRSRAGNLGVRGGVGGRRGSCQNNRAGWQK